jgi:predicted HTH transcriptional regulator
MIDFTFVFEKVTDFTCLTIRVKRPLTPRLSDDSVNEGVKNTLKIIRDNPGITVPQIAARLDKSDATIERHIRILRQKELIKHQGPAKTGGYYAIKK